MNTSTEVTLSCGAMLLVPLAFDTRGFEHRKTVRQCSSKCDLNAFDLGLIFTAPSTVSRQLIVTVLPHGKTGIVTRHERFLRLHICYKFASLTTISLDNV